MIAQNGRRAIHVAVTGGSQGSRTLNNAAAEAWKLFADAGAPIHIIHQAGRGNAEPLTEAFSGSGSRAKWWISSRTCRQRLPGPISWSAVQAHPPFRNWPLQAGRVSWCRFLSPPTITSSTMRKRWRGTEQRASSSTRHDGRRLFDEVTRLMMDRQAWKRWAPRQNPWRSRLRRQKAADVLLDISR